MATVLGSVALLLSAWAPQSTAATTAQAASDSGVGQAHAPTESGAAASSVKTAVLAAPDGFSVRGIDVASYQAPINWAVVAASGVSFAYVKATEGTGYTNPYFAADMQNARANGLYVGAYSYARPDSANPVAQADYFADAAGYTPSARNLPPFVDLEYGESVGQPRCYNLTPAQMVAWMASYLARLTYRFGRLPMIYTNAYWWNQCTGSYAGFSNYPLNIANYGSAPSPLPAGFTTYKVWQYSSNAGVPGVSSATVDGDVFNGTLADLDAFARSGGSAYELNTSGEIYASSGASCSDSSCPGWVKIDNNPSTRKVQAGVFDAFQLHADGSIYQYVGPGCFGSSCTGWVLIDNNPATTDIVVSGSGVYQLHGATGRLWRWNGGRSWTMIDANPATRSIAADGGSVYELQASGALFRWGGGACNPGCTSWSLIDANPNTRSIAGGGAGLYQYHASGAVFRWNGAACNPTCTSWSMMDDNPLTTSIVVSDKQLFQLHRNDGTIWASTGAPCTGTACGGWLMIDNNPYAAAISAGGTGLFQRHSTGAVYRWTAAVCSAQGCLGWTKVDQRSSVTSISVSP